MTSRPGSVVIVGDGPVPHLHMNYRGDVLARYLASHSRHEVVVVAPHPGAPGVEARATGFPGVRFVDVRRTNAVSTPRDAVGRVGQTFAIAQEVRRLIRSEPIACIRTISSLPTLSALLARRGGTRPPILANLSDFYSDLYASSHLPFPSLMAHGVQRLERACSKADAVIVDTPRQRDRWAATRGIRPDRCAVLPHGLPRSLAPSGQGGPVVSLRSDFEIPDGEPIAMYVGDMSDMDGLDVLYRAVALARSFGSTLHLVIIGMGSAAYLDVLDALASELAITGHVHRVQSVPNQHLPQLFDQADVCVSPFRLRDTSSTAIPNKVLEYLTSRRPIVSTGGSALEWAFGPAIRYVPPENPQELALAVLRASSEGLTATEGVARASIHEAFAWPSILAREVDLIDRVIKDDLAGVTELDFDFSSVWVQRCLREDLDRGSP